MIRRFVLLFALLLVTASLPARAQDGCTDSPEDPTVALALVGGLGATIAYYRSSRSRKQ